MNATCLTHNAPQCPTDLGLYGVADHCTQPFGGETCRFDHCAHAYLDAGDTCAICGRTI